jgi:hypothetical protein
VAKLVSPIATESTEFAIEKFPIDTAPLFPAPYGFTFVDPATAKLSVPVARDPPIAVDPTPDALDPAVEEFAPTAHEDIAEATAS